MRRSRAFLRPAVYCVSAVLLASCAGVSDIDILRLNDIIDPVIVVTSPTDGDPYAPAVTISGTVNDAATANGDDGQVLSLGYSVSPANTSGDISFGADGSFSFDVNGSNFVGIQTITLTGTDWNENLGTFSFTLEAPKEITYFAFLAASNPWLSADAIGTIGTISGPDITLSVPEDLPELSFVASFVTTGTSVEVGGVAQTSGVTIVYFDTPVTYTVVANDGRTRDYLVTVLTGDNAITSFSFLTSDNSDPWLHQDVTAGIAGDQITASVSPDVDVSALVASFTHAGVSIDVNGVSQVSGVTVNSFVNPVVYTVTAENGATQDYTVTAAKLPSGYRMIADLNPSGDSSPELFTVYDGKLYFSATDGSTGTELWVYDEVNGPSLAADINAGAASSSPQHFAVYDSALYFQANDGTSGAELWVYDEAGGANRVDDLNSGSGHSLPRYLAVYNGKLYFSATDGLTGSELYQYDGITVSLAAEIVTGSGGSDPRDLTAYDGELFFYADHASYGPELWRYDQANGASLAEDIVAGTAGSYPLGFAEYLGKLYFPAFFPGQGGELWKYDTTNGASLAAEIRSGTTGSFPSYLTVLNDTLYFRATDGIAARLWQYDETNGASIAAEISGEPGASGPDHIVLYNGRLLFNANDGFAGSELWAYDEIDGGGIAADIASGSGGSFPSNLAVYDGKLYFQAYDPANGEELWVYSAQ